MNQRTLRRPKRLAVTAVIVTVLALVAVACGGDAPVAERSSGSEPTAATSTDAPAAATVVEAPNADAADAADDGDAGGDSADDGDAPSDDDAGGDVMEDDVVADDSAGDRADDGPAAVASSSSVEVVEYPTGVHPVRVTIPAIGVDAVVIDLDLRGDAPEVPADFAEVGWYTQTRLPGEIGPAVLAGHIDSRTGPAVFYRLDELEPGDEITVADADGQERTFAVVGSGQYGKDALPAEVFGVTGDGADLRLITCGGTFDAEVGHYRDNYVVYATAV